MAIWSERRRLPAKRPDLWSHVRQQALLIPEAIVLALLLFAGWLAGFPAAIGGLALLVAIGFGARLLLLAVASRRVQQGDYAIATRLIHWALVLNPWSRDALLLQAQSLTQRGDDEAAETVLRRAAALYPGDESLQSVLAGSMLAQGRMSEGWRAAHAAGHSDERLPPAIAQQRAWIAMHLEQDPARARAIVLRAEAERLPPRSGLPLLVTLAEATLALGAAAESQRLMQRIEDQLAHCPRAQQAELLYHLGRLHTAHGDGGASFFRRSVELDPHGRYAQSAWRAAVDG
jgi:hypothetical protein